MGNWVDCIVTCREADQQQFRDRGFTDPYDEEGPWIRLMGTFQPDPELFRDFPPCLAWLGPHPNDLDPLLVAWDGTELRYVPCDSDEFPVIRVGADGVPEQLGLDSVHKYQELEKKVNVILGIEEEPHEQEVPKA